jgi:hypothetical protein
MSRWKPLDPHAAITKARSIGDDHGGTTSPALASALAAFGALQIEYRNLFAHYRQTEADNTSLRKAIEALHDAQRVANAASLAEATFLPPSDDEEAFAADMERAFRGDNAGMAMAVLNNASGFTRGGGA